MSLLIGQIAALATSLLWATSSSLFTLGGRRQNPYITNRVRLLGATLLLLVTHLLFLGIWIPTESLYVWLLLGLSGIIGLALGDGMLFLAYVRIGPRVSMLLMSMVPIVTTAVAWVFFAERLSLEKMAAILIVIGGISMVVLERRKGPSIFKVTLVGILFGIGAMLGQAIGLLIAKEAMENMLSANAPLSATLLRMIWGTAAIWLASIGGGKIRRTVGSLKDVKFMRFIVLAMIFGPYLGIWASYIAIDNAPVGIASTLMALPPLFMIPISRIVFKESITIPSVVGTVITLFGVAIIFLEPVKYLFG
ncbi:MAG: DMT family transporter [Candidatus Thermoplasmatota archaeon]|nr:DMT family transporter [Candidatus Thermoplasmatota archaeon]